MAPNQWKLKPKTQKKKGSKKKKSKDRKGVTFLYDFDLNDLDVRFYFEIR